MKLYKKFESTYNTEHTFEQPPWFVHTKVEAHFSRNTHHRRLAEPSTVRVHVGTWVHSWNVSENSAGSRRSSRWAARDNARRLLWNSRSLHNRAARPTELGTLSQCHRYSLLKIHIYIFKIYVLSQSLQHFTATLKISILFNKYR